MPYSQRYTVVLEQPTIWANCRLETPREARKESAQDATFTLGVYTTSQEFLVGLAGHKPYRQQLQ